MYGDSVEVVVTVSLLSVATGSDHDALTMSESEGRLTLILLGQLVNTGSSTSKNKNDDVYNLCLGTCTSFD